MKEADPFEHLEEFEVLDLHIFCLNWWKKLSQSITPLPFEVGVTYTTKFATGEKFTVTRVRKNRYDEVEAVFGIYEKSPHLGECPLNMDRLIPDVEKIGERKVIICPNCKHEIPD